MKKQFLFIAIFVLITAGSLSAAVKDFTFTVRTKVIRDGRTYYEYRPHTYQFRIDVISDIHGYKHESHKWNRPFIYADPQERYSVRIHNPMPVRVAVNLSVDGLNSITGEPGKPSKGKKWIIEPNSYVTIRGWQVNDQDARRFFFTTREASYASWRSNQWGKDLSVNCGVIGAAFFWSENEMEDYFRRYPLIENTYYRDEYDYSVKQECESLHEGRSSASKMRAPKPQAGTGMGERQSHPVHRIRFDYDTGMYRTDQALIIYYDFPPDPVYPPIPRPFEGYAPEMP